MTPRETSKNINAKWHLNMINKVTFFLKWLFTQGVNGLFSHHLRFSFNGETPASMQMTESPKNMNTMNGKMWVEDRVTCPSESTSTKRKIQQ